MKNLLLIIVYIYLSSTLLVACGQSSSPTAFMSTSADTLMFLQWHSSDNGQLSGQWYQVQYAASYFTQEQEHVNTRPITGTLNGQQVTIQSNGLTLYTGSEQNDGLTLNGANSQGQTQSSHWYATDQNTYNQFVSVFEAHMNTRVQLAVLSQTLNLIPDDSDPATAQAKVQGVKNEVSSLQSTWNDEVQGSQTEKCSGLQAVLLFYPLPASDFTAPDASKSTLASQIAQVQTQWTRAQAVKQPELPTGMTTPWKLTKQQVMTALQPAQRALVNVQAADKQAQQQLTSTQNQYTTLSSKVEALKATC